MSTWHELPVYIYREIFCGQENAFMSDSCWKISRHKDEYEMQCDEDRNGKKWITGNSHSSFLYQKIGDTWKSDTNMGKFFSES